MYKLDITLRAPTYIISDIFEDMWEGFIAFLLFLIWLITTILNLATLGIFGFFWKLAFMPINKKQFSHCWDGYEINIYGKKIYEKPNLHSWDS